MKFSNFIRENLEAILGAWEAFARTLPAAKSMSRPALRDHCREILLTIAGDMDTAQTRQEQSTKSMDLEPPGGARDSPAESHGTLRHLAGFDLIQLVAEFRAMRASVLSLWQRSPESSAPGVGIEEVTRFNEGIDQALAESVERFSANLAASRDMFLGVLGHDLRGPLSTIALANTLLAKAELPPSERRNASERTVRAISEMNRLIADLLDYTSSRLGAGIPIEAHSCDVGAICEDALEAVQGGSPAQSFELRKSGDLSAEADAAKLGQALRNLLLNAVQHGDRSQPIELSATGEKSFVVLKVCNQGAPIPVDALPRIFEPLTRFPSPAELPDRSQTSMGLGLFIVREIVNGHLGDITVESSAETGTVFSIRIPRVTANLQKQPDSEPVAAARGAGATRRVRKKRPPMAHT
ncbi:MAG: HAMP domain-containing sensor histidine kinase [Casimicrobiaceae bacterium]